MTLKSALRKKDVITHRKKRKSPQKTYPETPLDSLLHNPHEFDVAEAIVSVLVEELKDSIDQMLGELVAGGDLHSPLELR